MRQYNLELAKRYVPLIPDEPDDTVAIELKNPGLAELYREVFLLIEPCPDWLTEAQVIKQLDAELIP